MTPCQMRPVSYLATALAAASLGLGLDLDPGRGMAAVHPVEASVSLSIGPSTPPRGTYIPDLAAGECMVSQNASVNAQLGIQGTFGPQTGCLPGNTGDPGNLIGFAFPLASCMAGCMKSVSFEFNIADAGDEYHYYLWRSLGGEPNDACGLEAFSALNRTLGAGPYVDTVVFGPADVVLVDDGERLLHGAVYVTGRVPADWFIGRENTGGLADKAFGNLSGNHGDWADLNGFGFGNRWGVSHVIKSDCGATPVEPSTWGSVKALYR